MEFFTEIDHSELDVVRLQEMLVINNLPVLCDSIETVISEEGDEGEIYCVWGQFKIRREIIRYGIRFTLLNCPHALAWTITVNAEDKKIVVHCTIDKKEQDKDFIDSIDVFVRDWEQGLRTQFSDYIDQGE